MEETFASVLRTERVSSGISEREAASLIGVSNATWSRWERGEMYPANLNTLDKVCGLLGLNLFYMIALIYPDVQANHSIEFDVLDSISMMTEADMETTKRVAEALAMVDQE